MKKKALKLPSENERVCYLLDFLFEGNQSKMADALGIPQPVISRVATGKLRPGKKLITALTGHPKVNPAWLATGKGDPLLANETSTSEGWPVPVASCLLPGGPSDCKKMLTPLVQYVPGVMYRDSLYAVKADHCMPQDMEDFHILPDDLLLIETDSDAWNKNINSLNRRLVVVLFDVSDLPEALLTEVKVTNQDGERILLALSVDQNRERRVQQDQAKESLDDFGRGLRPIDLGGETPIRNENKGVEIAPSQIAGIVVQLLRNFCSEPSQ